MNQLSQDVVAEITKTLSDGFLSLHIKHRIYRGKIKVKLTYKGKYHFCTIIDSMDEYNNAVAELLSQLLCDSIDIKSTNNLDVLSRNLRDLGIGMNRTNYITKSQTITLNKLIQVNKGYITTYKIEWGV